MRLLLTFLGLLCLTIGPAYPQDGPPLWQGMAVSQAPEAGTGVCFGTDMGPTIDCARQQCASESGLGLDTCQADLWCSPHGFAADIFMQHAEGPHWHEFLCGAASRDQLDALIAVKCDLDYLIECTAVRIWDRDSNQLLDLGD